MRGITHHRQQGNGKTAQRPHSAGIRASLHGAPRVAGPEGETVGSDPITDQIPDPPSFDVTTGRGVPSDNTTLVDVLHRYETAGYAGQFGTAVTSDGATGARCFTCGTVAPPETVEVVSMR